MARAHKGGAALGASVLASVTRLHIVAIATLGTWTFGWLFFGRTLWVVSAISGLDWLLVNLLNRVADLPEDRANDIAGTASVTRHRHLIVLGGFALVACTVVAAAFIFPALTPFRAAYHLLGISYNWPLFPGRRRLKQLYAWKNIASATGFLLTVFAYPLASVRAPLLLSPVGVVVLGLFFFLFELSYEVIYDLRDVRGDELAHVRTFPVVHGPRWSSRFIQALLFSSAAVLAAGFAARVIPWRAFVMVFAPALQWVYFRRVFGRGISSRDCIRLTWIGAALLAAYHLWIFAKLPGVGM